MNSSARLALVLVLLALTGCGGDEPTPRPEPGPPPPDPTAVDETIYEGMELPTARTAIAHPGATAVEIFVRQGAADTFEHEGKPITDPSPLEERLDADRDHDHLRGIATTPILVAADARVPWGSPYRVCLLATMAKAPLVSLAVRDEQGLPGALPLRLEHLLDESPDRPWLEDGFELALRRHRGEAYLKSSDDRVPAGALAEVADALPLALASIRSEGLTPVVRLRMTADVDTGDVARLVDLCRRAGLERIHLVPPSAALARVVAYPEVGRRGPLQAQTAAPKAVRRALRLPVATNAKEETNDGHEVVEVALTADGAKWCRGATGTFEELRKALRERADRDRRAGRFAGTHVGLLLTVDARAPWQRVQWLMQTAADPDVMMDRIFLNVRTAEGGPEGQLRAFLPRDPGLSGDPSAPRPQAPISGIKLERDESGGPVHLYLARLGSRPKEIDLGADGSGWAKIAKQLKVLHGRNPGAGVRIDASRTVPYAEVIRAVDLVLGSGLTNLQFTGTPPPPPGD